MKCDVFVKTVPVYVFFIFHNKEVRCSFFENRSISDVPKCPYNQSSPSLCILETICPTQKIDQNNYVRCIILVPYLDNDDQLNEQALSKLPDLHIWIYSLGSAFVISIAGVWGYFFLPLMIGPYRDHVMNVLIGLSFGSLVTSALCQLIPEAFEIGKLSKSTDYFYVAVFSMFGLWFTWCLQSVASIIGKDYPASSKSPYELKTLKNDKSNNVADKTNNHCTIYTFAPDSENGKQVVPPDANNRIHDDFSAKLIHRSSSASYTNLKKKQPKLSKLAIVILVGDCLNNFMDGISMGAAFSHNLSTGIKLSAAIAFEEYTHKLGDFAIVFQSGVPMSRVLFWNYTTSCACFVGIVLGIALGNMHWSPYIFSFASGLFLIIALSNMIPEMQNMLDENLNRGKVFGYITLIEQQFGFLLAFVLLLIISVIFSGHNGTAAVSTAR